MPHSSLSTLLVSSLLTLASAVEAAVLTIQPQNETDSKDTKIYASVPTGNFSSNLNVVSPDITDFRSLVQFDLSSLSGVSAGDVTQAVVRLYVTGLNTNGLSTATQATVTISPILGAWRENAADPGLAPLGVWDVFFGASASLSIGAVAATQTVTGIGYFDWDVTLLAKSWLDGSLANNGFMLQAVGPNGDVGIADTVDGTGLATPTLGPALIVTTVPEPALTGVLALGLGLLVARRKI